MDFGSSLCLIELFVGVPFSVFLHEFLHWLPGRMFGYEAKIHLGLKPYTHVEIPQTEQFAAQNLIVDSTPAVLIPVGYFLWTLGFCFGIALISYNLVSLLDFRIQKEGVGDLRRIFRDLRTLLS